MTEIECSELMQGCADCDMYTPVSTLIEKPDGRKVCRTCQGKIERLSESKRQLDFFGQESLFN